MHGSTENQRGAGQFAEAPQPQPMQFQLGTNDQGDVIMALHGQVVGFAPAEALKIAATICGLVAQQLAAAPKPEPKIVVAGAMPPVLKLGTR